MKLQIYSKVLFKKEKKKGMGFGCMVEGEVR
jgi:hypothetical protein